MTRTIPATDTLNAELTEKHLAEQRREVLRDLAAQHRGQCRIDACERCAAEYRRLCAAEGISPL